MGSTSRQHCLTLHLRLSWSASRQRCLIYQLPMTMPSDQRPTTHYPLPTANSERPAVNSQQRTANNHTQHHTTTHNTTQQQATPNSNSKQQQATTSNSKQQQQRPTATATNQQRPTTRLLGQLACASACSTRVALFLVFLALFSPCALSLTSPQLAVKQQQQPKRQQRQALTRW